MIGLARAILSSAELRQRALSPGWWSNHIASRDELEARLAARWREASLHKQAALVAQEEIDWLVYAAFGLYSGPLFELSVMPARLARGQRPFEKVKRARSFVREAGEQLGWHQGEVVEGDVELSTDVAKVLTFREKAMRNQPELGLIEDHVFKRAWRDTEQNQREGVFRVEYDNAQLLGWLADRAEGEVRAAERLSSEKDILGRIQLVGATVIDLLAARTSQEPRSIIRECLMSAAVPFLCAYRHTETGREKFRVWNKTWKLQRREDAGEDVGVIAVPPKFDQEDFRDPIYWRLRGKLDVPKERFISYPGCESDEDGQSIYGWAGWNHPQRARELAALYQDRKTREGWEKARLVPMLAGLLELIPWVKQWHNEPSAEYNGLKLGDYFEGFLKGECAELGVTEEDLRAWRPPQRGAGSKAAKSTRGPANPTSPESASAKPRRHRQKPSEDE
jgi:hypothetical protein